MNKTLNSLFGAMLLAASASVFAASSTDLTVTGFITPSACEPSLSNGGKIDYAKIPVKDLNADKPTALGEQTLQLTVTCDEATEMALEAKDNQEGSDFDNDPSYRFGLGLINGTEKLGDMEVFFRLPMADGVAVRHITSEDDGVNWKPGYFLGRIAIVSVADVGSLTPKPVQSLTTNLVVNPRIAPTNQLTLTDEVPINGSVTLTVRYL